MDRSGGPAASRRAVLAGAGAAGLLAVTGCAVYGAQPVDAPAPPVGDPDSGAELAKVGDIPVGGGQIIAGRRVVVTQPAAGTFACFGAVCTHQGCLVSDVSGGTINCSCHGSRFNIADGSVASGPATRPLPPVAIAVDGDTIRRS